eukprot:7541446-Pyramimonas_sp.AAC.1
MRRGRSEAKDADDFLVTITEEDCLLLSMMSDAADEVNQVTVFADKSSYDVTEFASRLSMLIRRCDALFLQRCALTSGYTKHMIDTMSLSPLIFNIGTDNGVRSLGGPGKLTQDGSQVGNGVNSTRFAYPHSPSRNDVQAN